VHDRQGRCQAHQRQLQALIDSRRGSAASRGYDSRWRAARAAYLRAHPLCRECEAAGAIVAASVVDHIMAHKGDKALFWDSANWQPLCKPCHDRKTAREDGRWG
jgi:5-methylcytosine-specific restriction protein A